MARNAWPRISERDFARSYMESPRTCLYLTFGLSVSNCCWISIKRSNQHHPCRPIHNCDTRHVQLTPPDPLQRLVWGQALRIYPTFQLGTGSRLDHIRGIDPEVETEDERGGERLESGPKTPGRGCV